MRGTKIEIRGMGCGDEIFCLWEKVWMREKQGRSLRPTLGVGSQHNALGTVPKRIILVPSYKGTP